MSGVPPLPVVADPFFARLKALVIEGTGMAFYADKDEDLARIVTARLMETGLTSCARYLDRLADPALGRAEMDALVAELTIGETYFFRHREQFDALRDIILPDVIARNQNTRRLRIWSAGCATGPEPYSVAIMLLREFGDRIAGWDVGIIGTDINRKFLERAREGRYDEWAFRATPNELRRACFEPAGKQWQIRPEYKECVSFQYHNLISSRFPSLLDDLIGVDIIICRNVVIYFSRETVESLVPCFHETLADGGWLVMGHAEPNADTFRNFRTVNTPGAILYQRTSHCAAPAVADVVRLQPALPLEKKRGGGAPPPQAHPGVMARPTWPGVTKAPPALPAPDVLGIRALADQGRWGETLAACDQALAVNGLDAWAHFYKALVLEHLGDLDGCETFLRRAIYLDRHLVLPHYHLGLFLWRRNDLAGAARSFRNVLGLLGRLSDDQILDDGGDMSVAELRGTVGMHLEQIGAA